MKFDLDITLEGDEEAQRRLKFMSESFVGAPRRVAKKASEILLESLKRMAPEGHNEIHIPNLRESLGFLLSDSGGRWIARFYGNYYVKWVIDGRGEVWAGIYTGRSSKRFLRFEIDGKEIFTTHVGAARANDFREPALRAARPEIEAIMREEGIRTIRGVL